MGFSHMQIDEITIRMLIICHIIIIYGDSVFVYGIKNKSILRSLPSFSYNGPNYNDPFNGLKRN
ncbi:hypothetical protein BpHYR1_013910 [Brachionus plicatilis]|uniref:Uncharacterized protein n=1 Tax=Brachionus plicatilis TaxID=10195 RepID=A0A3M7QEM0_BRAPC|nr:hypothetical protein BpHYR1_013910 [Brachionus plicatilis]